MLRRLIILLLIVGCEEPSQHGCLDSQACNYDADATIDNNSCEYESDCAGVCGGNASYDICGVCGGDGYPDGACDCGGNVEDVCGVCGGNNSPNTGNCDCEGTPNGNMVEDAYGGCCSSISTDFCDCNSEYVSLWGECYSISNTTTLSNTDNSDKGSYPQIGYLVNLTNLSLTGNGSTDEIAIEISNLTKLTYLSLSNFVGTIPPEIWGLTDLTYLSLSGNSANTGKGLTGTIPINIGNLINLTFFSLHDNLLSGEIPSEIGNLVNVLWLGLYANRLSGTVPNSICNIYSNGSANANNFYANINGNCFPSAPQCVTQCDVVGSDYYINQDCGFYYNNEAPYCN